MSFSKATQDSSFLSTVSPSRRLLLTSPVWLSKAFDKPMAS